MQSMRQLGSQPNAKYEAIGQSTQYKVWGKGSQPNAKYETIGQSTQYKVWGKVNPMRRMKQRQPV